VSGNPRGDEAAIAWTPTVGGMPAPAGFAAAAPPLAGPAAGASVPTVTEVLATPALGIAYPGDTITLTLDLSATVTVTGTPTLTLNDGGHAVYSGGSGSQALTFAYTVGSHDQTVATLAITGVQLPDGAAVTDAAGHVADLAGAATALTGLGVDPPSDAYVDGSAGAPAGTPQLPDILSGYAARPPWQVAGVDYAVGVASGTTLLDPTVAGNLPAGASYNASTHTVTVTGNNVTLEGLDFSLYNGIQLVIESTNVTVQNCNFAVGSNQGSLGEVVAVTSAAGNVTFLDNDFNGNDVAVTAQQGALLSIENHGTINFEYNYFQNTGGDVIDFSGGPQVDDVQYNVFANVGVNTAHADTLQWYDSQITSGVVGFNTVYQDVAQSGPGNGALTILSEGPTATMTDMMENNDTIIQAVAGSGNFTTGFYADEGGTASGVTLHDLYIDPTGAVDYTGMWLLPTGSYGDALANPTAITNVTNMVTGTTYTTLPTAQGYYVAPDVNGYSPSLNDIFGITASVANATETIGDTVTFTMALDESYTVAGTPTLSLNDGGTATYTGGSGTSTLTFSYTVGAGDNSVSALAVTGVTLPTGTTVTDAVGNAANLSGVDVSLAGLAVSVACFAEGTRIATPAGAIAVEDLRPGGHVLTAEGGAAPVRWVGVQTVATRFGDPLQVLPIRIRAGALAPDTPSHDLLLSPGHAVLIEQLLVQAGALVNAGSIARCADMSETFRYYHVELATHSVILAEGAPVESYLDAVELTAFDNVADRPSKPDGVVELPYPRIKAHRQLPAAIRAQLASRSAALSEAASVRAA
jgi:hypothetical protein